MATSPPPARGGANSKGPAISFGKEPVHSVSMRGGSMLDERRELAQRPRSKTVGDKADNAIHESRRMSMPMRQSSILVNSGSVRTRATSAAAAGGDGGFDVEGRATVVDDEDDDRTHNLTFDGVKEGAYMLCKRSDDLLGHHARQVFREKAASMRGENSIFYYLKDLMKKFGSDKMQKKALTSEQLILEAHEFRKLVTSDPAFQAAIPEDHIDALFHRIEHEDGKGIRHLDFVEFCLLDHHQLRLLLFKFRKQLIRMRLSDNEITDTFRRLTAVNGASISSDLLHAAIARELDVVLTAGELRYLLQLLDLDGDGDVKVNDFEVFVKDDRISFDLIHPTAEHGVVDLKLSMSELDEANLKREAYTKLSPGLHDESSAKVHLWYKVAPKGDGKSAITNIRYAPTSRDSELVSKGYTCLQQDVNRAGAFGKHKYIWMSYVPPNMQSVSEVIDLCLSSGDVDDKKDAKLWMPMYRGFKLVPGDLNDRSTKSGIFLWIRRRPMHAVEDVVETNSDEVVLPDSPRARSKVRLHADELEAYVRQILRRNCPVEQDGAINFARLFDEFDQKKNRAIGKQATLAGIESFGIKMKLKDFPLVWDRINPSGKKTIDVATFTHFLEMTDSEIDDTVSTLQRTMTTKSTQQLPNYRLIFQSYNALGDGRLSRSDFQRLLAANQVSFSNTELSKVIQRFDVNRDGVVDYDDFVRYVTGTCDTSARVAQRISDAADELKTWAMEKQNKKLAKDGQIDSSASWKLLRPKRGTVDIAIIDHLLRERMIRLDANKLKLLKILIAPATNGEINQAAYHAFVNHQPRKIKTMVYDLKKIAGPIPLDGAADGVFDRLNTEGNGRLSLVSFAKEINTLAAEKNAGVGPFDLKDFVYIVQWAGADCGGDGAILIDRFLAAIRDNLECRNMKHEYVTNYDSPGFIEGVKVLRDELRRCAKTPDGKFNFIIPFRMFDKDKSGQIVLSEFEAAIRELAIDKYMSDQEIKSLMRRFDLNSSGGINYDEFLRFNMVEPTSKTNALLLAEVEPILLTILSNERLTPATIAAFCSSIKRMFGIIDKETHGVVSNAQFEKTLDEVGLSISADHIRRLLQAFSAEDIDRDMVCYNDFCDALQRVCDRAHDGAGGHAQLALTEASPQVFDLLCNVYQEFQGARQSEEIHGKPAFDIHNAFGIAKCEKSRSLHVEADDLKEVLWASGVKHPFLREDLESIIDCFRSMNGGFNASSFCGFLERGPSILLSQRPGDGSDCGAMDGYIMRLHDAVRTFTATGGKDAEDRLARCFADFDEDGSGELSHDEFVHVLHKAGLRRFLSPDDEHILLRFLDANGDGVISYKEFVEFAKNCDKRLNVAVQKQAPRDERDFASPPSSPSRSMAPSPPRSPGSRPPSPHARGSSPGRGRNPESASPKSTRPPHKLVTHIAKLNSKLPSRFPFDKYFAKYRVPSTEDPVVKSRVFHKVIDKFLARLVEHSIAYSMHELDADSLTRLYEITSGSGGVAHFGAFLSDLAAAAKKSASRMSDSSDDEDRDLSCSSDEGESKSKRASKIAKIVSDTIQRLTKTKQEQEALRTKVKAVLAEFEKAKKDVGASEQHVFKMLAKLGLRLHKKEAELILSFTRTAQDKHDLKKLAVAITDQIGSLLGEGKKPVEASAAVTTSKPSTQASGISAALSDKIYKGFIAAAQQNISGRRLLEKCDPSKSGVVTFADLQAVLRLIGCVLSEAELTEIKSAYGATSGATQTVNYRQLVQQLTKQLAPSAPRAAEQSRPPPIQVAPLAHAGTGKMLVETVAPPAKQAPSTGGAAPIQQAPARPLSSDALKKLDGVLRPYFQELLATRRIDTQSLLKTFGPYDVKGTGFVSPDALPSVLRKFDVWLSDEMARSVLSRFTAATSNTFDYIEFSSFFGSAPPANTKAHDAGDAVEQRAPVAVEAAKTTSRVKPPEAKPVMREQHSGWKCPVCLHSQTRASATTCEICCAQNPASAQYQVSLICTACDFRNAATATQCSLCRLPLSADAKSTKPTHPHNLQLQIPPIQQAPSYDEDWVA